MMIKKDKYMRDNETRQNEQCCNGLSTQKKGSVA
jgi:hypothetical protein